MNKEGKSLDLKPGELHYGFAIVLHSFLLQESDKMVHLLTHDVGKVSAVAKKAARSVKRFGASLEPFCLVKAQLKVPKNFGQSGPVVWSLESVDLKDSFTHLRNDYQSLNAAASVTRLILDNIPDGPTETEVFKAYGRFLRDSEVKGSERHFEWFFMAFWTWFSKFLGYGRLDEFLWNDLKEQSEVLLELWQHELSLSEPNFKQLFESLTASELKKISRSDREKFYRSWLQASGMTWAFFERGYLSQ